MIHQVKVSQHASNQLQQVIYLQLLLLRFGMDTIYLRPETIKAKLDSVYDNSVVSTWVARKTTLVKSLQQFASHPNIREKSVLVGQIEEDVQLLFTHNSGWLQAKFHRKTDPTWKKAVRTFLDSFYEYFTDGFPIGLADEETAFSRQDFISSFIKENGNLALCAACDTFGYKASGENATFTSIDHYFPKSRYPHLAIHPHNLVPICPFCNSWFKRSVDPLKEISDISSLLVPYGQQPGLSQQAHLKFVSRRRNKYRTNYPLELQLTPTAAHACDNLIMSFEKIYRVQKRWNIELEEITQHAFRRITQFLIGDLQSGHTLTVEFLEDRLQFFMALTSLESLGLDAYGYPTIWIAKHYLDEIVDKRQEAPIYIALQTWAIEQQKRWHLYQEHAREIIGRVPL